MAKVTLKINGQEVTVEKGTTILDAAKQIGVYIPTLCYHPFLPLEEACRICVVDDVRSGWSTQVAACVFPARNGMVIETDSEKVIEARKTILDLLLSDHPNECMTCQAAGECELQDLAYKYHATPATYKGAKHDYPLDSDPDSVLYMNMNKCVLCRRCIRACNNVQGAHVLTKKGRGFDQRITTAFELPVDESGCEQCGHCADFCPVDAIGTRQGRDLARSWEFKKTSSVCLQCAAGCRANYDVFENKIVRVRGDFDSPASEGALCKMGRFNFDFINSPDRLSGAMVRNGSKELADSSIEDAVKTAAAALKKVKDSAGGAGVGVICGGQLTNEEYYLAQKLARAGLGTNNIDSVAGPTQMAVFEGMMNTVGVGGSTGSIMNIGKAGAVLVLGSNTIEKHAAAGIQARKVAREGGVLIVANPEAVPMTKTASKHLALKAGSEGWLVLGMVKVILEENLYDKEFVEAKTAELDKLVKSVNGIKLSEVASKTGLTEEEVAEAARMYASKRPAALIYGIDAASPASDAFYQLCATLQLLLGSVDGINILGLAGNAQGAVDFGAVPKYLPGGKAVTEAEAVKAAGKLWKVDPPNKVGMSWPEMMAAAEKGTIKGLYFIGVDPFELGLPEDKVQAALSKLQVLVVQDSLKTKAAEMAHVVLPGATFVEKEGTATNAERRIQKLSKANASPSGACDFTLLNAMLGALKADLKVDGVAGAFAEAGKLVKEIAGASLDGICSCKGIAGAAIADGQYKFAAKVKDAVK